MRVSPPIVVVVVPLHKNNNASQHWNAVSSKCTMGKARQNQKKKLGKSSSTTGDVMSIGWHSSRSQHQHACTVRVVS